MENRYITITTLSKSNADLFSQQLKAQDLDCEMTEAKAVRIGEADGVRVKVRHKDRKFALRLLEQFGKTYGVKESEQDLFSREVERILVPVDFSNYSKNACQYAIGLAAKLGSEIMLMHAYYFPIINSIDYGDGLSYVVNLNDSISEIADRAKNSLVSLYEELKAEIIGKGLENVKLNFMLANGNPVNEIMDVYHKYRPDLIVMGTQGKTKEAKEQFGSVAATIIKLTKIPVLTIPEASKYMGIGKINLLYATNFDETDYVAIKKLMTMLYLFEVKINFVHIGTIEDEEQRKIDDFSEFFNNAYPGYEFEYSIIEREDILDSLQSYINERSIDIIAMNTHKRNFIARLFYPSMTKKMLFQTDTPLLVFHAK